MELNIPPLLPQHHVLNVSPFSSSVFSCYNTAMMLICMCVSVRSLQSVCLSVCFFCFCFFCMFASSNPLLCGQLKSDLVKEVAYTRRKQHQASLQYYCALNALQYRKRIAMLEPMLGYTQAQVPGSITQLELNRTGLHRIFDEVNCSSSTLTWKTQYVG